MFKMCTRVVRLGLNRPSGLDLAIVRGFDALDSYMRPKDLDFLVPHADLLGSTLQGKQSSSGLLQGYTRMCGCGTPCPGSPGSPIKPGSPTEPGWPIFPVGPVDAFKPFMNQDQKQISKGYRQCRKFRLMFSVSNLPWFLCHQALLWSPALLSDRAPPTGRRHPEMSMF